jgi:arylsulfatase A-like enzyme
MVNLMDLAPTFLEAANVSVPEFMTAKSLMPVLTSDQSGQIDQEREFVVVGRERHVQNARENGLPYPQRAIRTKEYLYIINFMPERWPMGDPRGLDNPDVVPPTYEELQWNTFVAYADMDASPTKAWMIYHRNEKCIRPLYKLGFDKRPYEELYYLKEDPDNMHNVAVDPRFSEIKKELNEKLIHLLREQNDPRVNEFPCRFELTPYAGDLQDWQK